MNAIGEEGEAPPSWDGVDASALLSLERLDTNLFRSRYNQPNLNGSLYGGQVFGQALAAATATVPRDRLVHSCHGYFLRPGRTGHRVVLTVEPTRDGGSFSSRRVVAMQDASVILHLECSFHVPEEGFAHSAPMADVPPPEALDDLRSIIRSGAPDVPSRLHHLTAGLDPIEMRPLGREGMFGRAGQPRRQCWFRVPSAAAAIDQPTHRVLLAYLSDFWLSGVTLMPHACPFPTDDMFVTSLDHAIWIHRDVQVDNWLLYDTDSPSATDGLGLARGTIHDRAGRLVASTAQEALQRPRR